MGIVDASTRNMSPAIIDQADRALRVAQQQNHNRICTGNMITIDHMIQCPDVAKQANLNRRRTVFLEKIRHLLGPTQCEHLTSHADRVSQVAIRIAQKMALPVEEINRIRMAALLHDIGKCLIPEQILAKPSALSIEEFQLMSLHAPLGAR
jgi:HD-GYP domain-containing protein (c-di-GMP phosphodiesterase class II)